MSKKSYRSLFGDMVTEWKWILRNARRYWWCIVLYAFLGMLGTAMGLAVSVFSKRLIDDVVGHSTGTIVSSALCVVGLALGQIVFNAVTSWITAVIGTRANNEMRTEVFSKVLGGRWEEVSKFHSGDLLNRLEGDVSTVSNGMIGFIPNVIIKALQFFGALGIVLYYDRTMAVLALLSAPILVFSSRYMVRTMRKFSRESRELNGKILSYSEESLRNLQVIKAFDITGQYIKNFKSLLAHYRGVRLKYEKFSVLMTLTLSVIGLVVSYACYGWGVWRLWQGAITFGTMTLFLQLSGTLSASFSGLVSLAPTAISIATSAGRIKEITERETENDADKQKASYMLKNGSIGVFADNVSFTYSDGESAVLDSVSFFARSGETIAFVGPSGEGKTTVLRLLLGLLVPQSGEMIFETGDGERISASDSTRRFCSYVPQKNGTFTGTIAENLRAVNPEATDEELESALKAADLWDFVSTLPNGVNSFVGENGVNFSEGQAQRISIARALLRKAPILIMDEATSALDAETEARVLKNIMGSSERTCIITTHRDSMLKYCDRIYRITHDGKTEELKNKTEEIE